jgi:hypothetical protein
MEPVNPDHKRDALRYVELQLKAAKGELSSDERTEMESILTRTGLSHDLLLKIATNDIFAE